MGFKMNDLRGETIGGCVGARFAPSDMRGARLEGVFVRVDFRACVLDDAELIGTFMACIFPVSIFKANTRRAHMHDCQFLKW